MPPLLKTIIGLPFLLLASARPQILVPGGSFAIGALDDWSSNGNYLIYSCASEASDIPRILDQTYFSLQTAIRSTDGSAYKAFFRSADPASVTAVLNQITAGANITTAHNGVRQPTLVCVNAEDRHIGRFWDICQAQDSGPTVVIQPPGTALVFLCPIFFSRKLIPEPPDCGIVNRAKTRLMTRTYIAGTQYGFLVQALADIYIQAADRARGKTVTPGSDVRPENACLELPPERAVRNPSSYAFYVSNVQAGCTQFPTRAPILPDRELLAITDPGDGNGTALVTIDCDGVGANNTSCPV